MSIEPAIHNPAPPLSIQLYGPVEVRIHGAPLPRLRSRKGTLLLAHLALRAGTPVDRTWLAGMLWPDSIDSQARANLRQILTDLRTALGREGDRLQVDGSRTVMLDLNGCELDTASFDALIAQGDRNSLAEAAALCRGPFMQDCDDESLYQEKHAHKHSAMEVLDTLARLDMETGSPESAAAWLRKLVIADPYRESAVRSLMIALASQGDYAGVTMAWRDLRERMRQELNQDPSAETTACFRDLRTQAGLRKTRPYVPTEPLPPDTEKELLPPPGHPGRLPSPLTNLVGREKAVRDVCERLSRSRLITLTGSGGVGKTRLSIQVAWESVASFTGGVRFVELAGITEPELVAQTAASALDVLETIGQEMAETLSTAIGDSEMLLLLDNCEHLIDACAYLTNRLLARCPKLRVLATSRQALGITGEVVWRVPSLSIPEGDEPAGEEMLAYDSVRLFVERASDSQPGFALDPDNLRAITQICRRLDGIPLALELAAARLRVLTVEQIADRLDRRFELLTRGNRAALPRQQTLTALVDWSYDHLPAPEQRLFRELSVFAGGWTDAAAEAVCSADDDGVFDLLASLVDKSLVNFERQDAGESRYHLLETLREYGRLRLHEKGEERRTEQAHADWCLSVVREAATGMFGLDEEKWLHTLDREQENMRSALDHGVAGRTDLGTLCRMTGLLGTYWTIRGRFTEARRWLDGAIKASEGTTDDEGRALVLNNAGLAAYHESDLASAERFHLECLDIRRRIQDRKGIAGSLNNLGLIHNKKGDGETARTLYLEALEVNREMENLPWQAINLNNLGNVSVEQGWLDDAKGYLEECLEINLKLGNKVGTANAYHNLGHLALQRGDHEAAYPLFMDVLQVARELGHDRLASSTLLGAATVALRRRDLAEARERLAETLKLAVDGSDSEMLAFVFASIGYYAFYRNCFEEAALLFGAEARQRERVSTILTPPDRAERTLQLEKIRQMLPDEEFEAAWNEGYQCEEAEAVRHAVASISDANPTAFRRSYAES